MTKTDSYKHSKKAYQNRWFTALFFMLVNIFPLSLMTMIIALNDKLNLLPKIILCSVLVVTIVGLTYIIASFDDFKKPNKLYNKKIEGTIKNKVLCRNRSTFHIDTNDIIYSNERAYFELETDKPYIFWVSKKYNFIGIYNLIESDQP